MASHDSNTSHDIVLNIDIDDCALLILEESKDDEDRILELSLDSFEMSPLRRLVSIQRLPSKILNKASTRLNTIFQSTLVIGVVCHYLYTLGAFKNKTLEQQEMGLTLNCFKIVVWNARHVMFAFCNLFYFTSTHIDEFVSSLRLTSRSLKKAKRWLAVACTIIVVCSVFVPAMIQFWEMWITPKADTKKEFSVIETFGNTAFMVIFRLIAIPIVIVFTIVFDLLYFEVRQFKKHLKSWPIENKQDARNFLVDILVKCKNAERGFQPWLIFHITILVMVIIPGIMSFVERARYEGQMTYTFDMTPWQGVTYHADNDAVLHKLQGKNISAPMSVVFRPFNVTSNTKTVNDREAQMRIGLQSLAFLAELLSLYLPLILLGKINSCIKRTSETIQCLKFEEQKMHGYLFQSRVELDEMLKDLSNAHGVHILGMEITIVKTWLLAVMMPLLTLVLHIIFKHVDLA